MTTIMTMVTIVVNTPQHILSSMDFLRRTLLVFFVALAPAGAIAQATIAPADARAIREVVEAQLDAFRRDDAARAAHGSRSTQWSANLMEAGARTAAS